MNTKVTARNLLIIVFSFMILSQTLYTFQNIKMFRNQYNQMTDEQVKELGEVIQNEISNALKYGIPIERLGRVNQFLKDIVSQNTNISFIDITHNGKALYTAAQSREFLRIVNVSIQKPDGQQAGMIRLGINKEVEKHAKRILFDLCTIVVAALIITYELLVFLASLLINIPGREALIAANTQISNLKPLKYHTNSQEMLFFLSEIGAVVESTQKRMQRLYNEMVALEKKISGSTRKGKMKVLNLIEREKMNIQQFMLEKARFEHIVNPAHVRPMVFTFVLAANLHSSFLPIFARDLLRNPTFLSGFFSESVLMGLPITVYMLTVMVAMALLGTSTFQKISPFKAISASLITTAIGLVMCGISKNVIHLILARILCGFGLALIVIQCRQYIVDHSLPEKRAYYMAGYTTAFSGGMFCSIVLGGILADYFSFRIVYFIAAVILIFVFIFTWIVFNDKTENGRKAPPTTISLAQTLRLLVRDKNLVAIVFHGIITRMLLVGYLYYSLPIFLKTGFTYSDIGRVMMSYGLTCVLLASFLNRFIKQARHSKTAILVFNILLGLTLISFNYIPFTKPLYFILAGAGGLVVMGIANSITFPSQINLLLTTNTVEKIGSRSPMALYQALEKVGSALGPLIFGGFAAMINIEKAIFYAGVICIVGNILFFMVYRADKRESPI